MSASRITSKGQVTIPKHIRDRRRIATGTEFEVSERGDEIVLRRADAAEMREAGQDPAFAAYVKRVRGTMDLGMRTDAFMDMLRGE